MDVRVADHQVDTGESLREHAQQQIAEITEKYFRASVGANVTFGRGPNNDYKCNIVAPVAQGIVLKATYDSREPEIAFNGAADRIEKQLRRYTRRLKDHKVDEDDQAYVENAGYTIFSAGADGRRGRSPRRPSLPRPGSTFPNSSVSDAVMLMDLRNTTALMFRTAAPASST